MERKRPKSRRISSHHSQVVVGMLSLLVNVAAGPPVAHGSPATGTAVASQPRATTSRPAGPVEYQRGVSIDWAKKQVLVAGEIVLRKGDLELFACSPNTKEHESIVRVLCRPLHVFQALGLIGLDAGHPPFYDTNTEKVVAATGQPLAINVRWTADGKIRQVPIWRWLWNKQTERPAGPIEWVFAGSAVTEDGRLLADLDGTVVTVVDFAGAIMAVPASHTSSNADLWLAAYTDEIPAAGTPVTLIIQAARPHVRVLLDHAGRLYMNDRPATLRETIEAARALADQQPESAASQPAATLAGAESRAAAIIEYEPSVSDTAVQQLVTAFSHAGLSDVTARPLVRLRLAGRG